MFDDSLLESCLDSDELLDMSLCVSPEICNEEKLSVKTTTQFNQTRKRRRLSDSFDQNHDPKRLRRNEDYDNDDEFHKDDISQTSLKIPCDSMDSFLYSEDWNLVSGTTRSWAV